MIMQFFSVFDYKILNRLTVAELTLNYIEVQKLRLGFFLQDSAGAGDSDEDVEVK